METNYKEELKYDNARKKVEQIKGFYGHLLSFVVVNLGLFVFNFATLPNDLWFDYWFYWNLLIWGIGLFIHGLLVFNRMPFFGEKWEEQKLKELLEKEKEQNNKWK